MNKSHVLQVLAFDTLDNLQTRENNVHTNDVYLLSVVFEASFTSKGSYTAILKDWVYTYNHFIDLNEDPEIEDELEKLKKKILKKSKNWSDASKEVLWKLQ
jgi:hypothetical protein